MLRSLLQEQAVNRTDRIHNDSDVISSSNMTMISPTFHNGIIKSIYDNIPQYSGDGDIQTLLDFTDKVDNYLTIEDNMSDMEIPLITMKLMGTASLLWRHHKCIYNATSPHRI